MLLALLGAAPARGEVALRGVPVCVSHVDPAVCFSAHELEVQIRRLSPGVELRCGGPGLDGLSVEVRRAGGTGDALDVELRREGGTGTARAEHHALPGAPSACAVFLETVAAMAVRAATPLSPTHATPPAPPARPPPAPPPPAPPLPPPPLRVVLPPVVVRGTLPAPALQLALALRVSLTPDGVAPGVGGLLSLAFRRRGVVLFAAVGLEQPVSIEGATAWAWQQRIPVLLGVGYDFVIPSGAIRLAAAGVLDLWWSVLVDPAGQTNTVWVHGGVHASLTYHLRALRWLDAFVGLDFEQSFQRERWIAVDRSLGIESASTWIDPKIGLSLNFL